MHKFEMMTANTTILMLLVRLGLYNGERVPQSSGTPEYVQVSLTPDTFRRTLIGIHAVWK